MMMIRLESNSKTPSEMENILCKALNTLQNKRSARPFEPPLQKPVQEVTELVDKILDNMIDEISDVLEGGHNVTQ